MNIVLVEPEIPANTGNIARTCAVTGSVLHLVKPLGFSVDDKHLKRAGLDYWHLLDIRYYENFQELKAKYPASRFYYVTTKGKKFYTDVPYSADDFLVFGKETAGLPKELLEENAEFCIRIPMINNVRSLNLSNSVAIVLYEAWRQQGFPSGT
ncbi:TrmH family RNA methyltransferase [Thermincola ferriacetica]|uniref:Putative tRNA (cytidine(34)-2'-O)-methyltransferase n=2 Tax=Thermincola TaxID=278993 RepID=D5XA58_THEPJ|nr:MULTISPECIES: tRNA (uridine(34)/cytosine(34)/5-carboxymethylaminomethyluridine(34)-2'-O)-methyltransferase TrmL [Thermincola]ADG83191.1 RNA methyltransferase, TrmH family, group 2 [Thermincola potens JR]KNZ68602.1 TrmH family RNA methyltransferase [Thermincola ferriacetica]